MVVMLSDCLVVHTARLHFEHIGKHNVIGGAASLNHTIWFHSFEDIDTGGSCTRRSVPASPTPALSSRDAYMTSAGDV
uniref:Amb_all domain-containing protein n=1 Tax=Steinernema glaseri TaxID=37863 RepID=A0A1I7Z6F5_9BILA